MNTFQSTTAAFKSESWLITANGFSLINEIMDGGPTHMVKAETMMQHRQKTNENESKDIAVLPVFGPMATYENFISQFLQWTTYESLARDIQKLDSTGAYSQIVLYMDTLGGMVNGLSEAANSVKSCNTPITAYAAGACASAGYWLASQCQEIVGAPDSVIGSIGTRGQFYGKDPSSVTSKHAPRKDMTREDVQALVDDFEALFIEAVADGRGISADDVKERYGQGGVMIGRNALSAGLIDRVSLFGEFVKGGARAGHDSEASIKESWAQAAKPPSVDTCDASNEAQESWAQLANQTDDDLATTDEIRESWSRAGKVATP